MQTGAGAVWEGLRKQTGAWHDRCTGHDLASESEGIFGVDARPSRGAGSSIGVESPGSALMGSVLFVEFKSLGEVRRSEEAR